MVVVPSIGAEINRTPTTGSSANPNPKTNPKP